MKKIIILVSILAITMGVLIYKQSDKETGDYIIDKSDNRQQILVAKGISKKDIKSISTLDEDLDLMYYDVEDRVLFEDLQIGEKVTVKVKTDENGHYIIRFSDPPQVVAGGITRHSIEK